MPGRSRPEVVVITGASAGIGRATAVEFARHHAKVALLARGRKGLESAAREVEEAGGEPLIIQADVADYDALEAAAQQVEEQLGPIDIWINNAMTSVFSPVSQMLPEEYKRVTEVTYLGQVYGTLAALKRMRPRSRGTIVQVGSALAFRGIPLQSAYCGAKHACEGFFDAVRSELIAEGGHIKITMVHPPGVNTPQFDWVKSRLPRKARPLGSVYQPEIIAQAIYWAAHNDRRDLVVGLPAMEAIWGNKFLPDVGDRLLAKKAYQGQQRSDPEDANRPNNLWEPVDIDPGSHGAFDDEAKSFSPLLWLSENRRMLTALALGACGVAAAAKALKRNGASTPADEAEAYRVRQQRR